MRAINHRVYELIGLARRAGKLISGSYAVEEAIKSGKAKLVIISQEASPNTLKKFSDMCGYRDIDIIRVGSKEELGKCIGKDDRTLVAVTDTGFKGMILDALPCSITNTGVID